MVDDFDIGGASKHRGTGNPPQFARSFIIDEIKKHFIHDNFYSYISTYINIKIYEDKYMDVFL